MRKFLISGLIAALAVPAVANAQTRELRRDRQDVREEQRDLQRERRQLENARRYGDRGDVREQRRDVRDAREDVREARQEYREDWRDYRHRNRGLYRAGRFDAPFRYRAFNPGVNIGPSYWAPRYRVSNVARWRLPAASPRQAYVRHYNDLLLIDTRSGRVARVYRGFYW
jgi:hypothetical protein